jgi:hypothetical protein
MSLALWVPCASADPLATDELPRPNARPDTRPDDPSIPPPSRTFVFDRDARSLDALEWAGATAYWFATLETVEGPTRFGELVATDAHGTADPQRPTVPLIGRVKGVADAALSIPDPDGRGNAWVHVAVGSNDGEIWGVLDAVQGEPNPALLLVRSTDAGRTWSMRSLRKPVQQATFAAMAMGADGHGTLVLHLAQEQAGHQPGFYPFTTSDAGQTWVAQPRRADRPVLPESGALDDGPRWPRSHQPTYRGYRWRTKKRWQGPPPQVEATPAPERRGRLRALENPGLDDRMERGEVPGRFDPSPE